MTDREIYIATAPTRVSAKWRNRKLRWSELVSKCSQTLRTNETFAEFNAMTKEQQSNVKDVGGFVGGYLRNGRRAKGHVEFRDILTLDIDFGVSYFWEDYQMTFDCASFCYSTHKHTPERPRIRLVILLSRSVTPEEYEAVGRAVAARIGIELFDDTTYESERLMYWPSTPSDMEFFFRRQDGEALDPDDMLATYHDWHNASEWCYSKRVADRVKHEAKKQGDPLSKPGIVGAFCRCYDIHEAIATFLSDIYEPAGSNRYTYTNGSVAAGLVLYEDGKFAYSHNNTDPCSMHLVNSFDLVRLHKYLDLDEDVKATDAINTRPSYKAMAEFAANDPSVRRSLTEERMKSAYSDFGDIDVDSMVTDEDDDWKSQLSTDSKGKPHNTIANAAIIIANAPGLKGRVWHDDFSGRVCIRGSKLPWRSVSDATRYWTNADYACLRKFLEAFGITGKDRIEDALTSVAMANHRHPVVDYLRSLTWDGTPRLDTLLIDFLGCENDLITRSYTRKHFVAAVKRVMEPGCKYDTRLTIYGPEGIGKSLLLYRMGNGWHTDSLPSISGKEGMEELQGSWIIEMAELASSKKADILEEKNFLSRQEDFFRPPYGRVKELFKRQCVFFGTTNERYFLKGVDGNRRQWVVEADYNRRKFKVWEDLTDEYRDQVWAEAVRAYDEGYNVQLSQEEIALSEQKQIAHNEITGDERYGMVAKYLDERLPTDWESWSVDRRRSYFLNIDPLGADGMIVRNKVCALEVYVECFGGKVGERNLLELRSINFLLQNTPGWRKVDRLEYMGPYGRQRIYERITQIEDILDDDL